MPVILIADKDDPRLTDYTQLTDIGLRSIREPAEGLYMAESVTVLERALQGGHQIRSVLTSARWLPKLTELLAQFEADPPIYLGTDEVITPLTGFKVHRGIIAAMHRPILPSVANLIANANRVAVLEDLVDHTNVGAIFRSAAAFGVDAVLVTPRCADPLYRRAVRVSMGTVFQVPWTRLETWPGGMRELQEAGFVVAALTLAENAISIDDLTAAPPGRLALLFGAEGHGLLPATQVEADLAVTIPMAWGVDSLNVAAASAVAFFATRPGVPA
ncbi:MAG: RNA methyltransferase [Cellulomonadaceae bacterium]|jgi:tRNA G18 (ribose-2'-O)-methylase SpoU|nr:RNA methyltransferase [Cellulomonadaceae bacterium]